MTVTTLALSPRYSGIELIATGGMADVYVATDESLDRLVAVKALNERFARDPEIRTRFTREARIAAKLSAEPNVVTIYDVTEPRAPPMLGGQGAQRQVGGAGGRPQGEASDARRRDRRGHRTRVLAARQPPAHPRHRDGIAHPADRQQRRARRCLEAHQAREP